jgi:hypothetical protein
MHNAVAIFLVRDCAHIIINGCVIVIDKICIPTATCRTEFIDVVITFTYLLLLVVGLLEMKLVLVHVCFVDYMVV